MACWPRGTRVYKRLHEYIVCECIWMYMNSINKSPGRSCSTCSEAAMWGFPPEVHASRKMKRRKMFASWHTAHCEHLLKISEKHYITSLPTSTNSTGSSGLLARAMCQSPPRSLFLCFARSQGVTAEPTRKFFYSILSWRSWTCGQWKAILLCLCWIKITLSARLVQSAPEKSLQPELVSAQQPTFCLEDLNGTKAIDRYRVRPSWVQNMCVESIQSCWGSMSSCRFKNETLGQEGMRRQ